MRKHEKAIRGGLTAEPYFRFDLIDGFSVYWCGMEVVSFKLGLGEVVWNDERPKIPESVEEYIMSFWAIVNRENTCQASLVSWWETFDRFAHDPLWYHIAPV